MPPSGPVSISEAKKLPGLRLIVLQGLPSPWSQAAKGILHVKQVPYTLVHRTADDPGDALEDWTGQASFPAAMFGDEPARTGWAEILLLAERLAPKPALIPADPERRALLFGLAHEIAGEMGLGWSARLQMIAGGMALDPPNPVSAYLGDKYGYLPETAAQAPGRVHDVLRMLATLLERSRKDGGPYLLGAELTALDIYWATFSNLIEPLGPDQMEMPAPMREMFTSSDPVAGEFMANGLRDHRDFIYREHLELPVIL